MLNQKEGWEFGRRVFIITAHTCFSLQKPRCNQTMTFISKLGHLRILGIHKAAFPQISKKVPKQIYILN